MSYGMVTWTPTMVQNADDQYDAFSQYVQQRLGTPAPTQVDRAKLKKEVKIFFKQYPHTDWHSLCRVVIWAASRKVRPVRVYTVLNYVRYAWAAGALPELDPGNATDPEADALVQVALRMETDPRWRRRLVLARSPGAKREVYSLWENEAMAP